MWKCWRVAVLKSGSGELWKLWISAVSKCGNGIVYKFETFLPFWYFSFWNLEGWNCESLELWFVVVWKCRSIEFCQSGITECGSMAVWNCEIVEVSLYRSLELWLSLSEKMKILGACNPWRFFDLHIVMNLICFLITVVAVLWCFVLNLTEVKRK